MRLRFLIVSLMVLSLFVGTGYAQTFTGTIDGYWSYNSNTPNNPAGNRFNPYRAFDTRDQAFSLNYGELAIDYKPNNVGLRVDVGFGDAAEIVHYNETDIWRHIQQAYITASRDKVTFDFGKFVTPFGAEVIETKDNWNYSRGFLFTYAIPFYHFGARTTYAASDKVSLGAYLVNGWDNVKDGNTAKSLGFVGTFKPHEKVILVTNFLTGKENPNTDSARTLYDGILTVNFSDRFSIMGNYDYGKDKGPDLLPGVSGPVVIWQGAAGYAKIKAHDKFTLSGRYEWLQDRHGFRTGTVQELQSYTVTAQVPVSDVALWLEFRKDMSNTSPFNKTSDGVFGPIQTFVDHQNTFTLGLTYTFTKMVN